MEFDTPSKPMAPCAFNAKKAQGCRLPSTQKSIRPWLPEQPATETGRHPRSARDGFFDLLRVPGRRRFVDVSHSCVLTPGHALKAVRPLCRSFALRRPKAKQGTGLVAATAPRSTTRNARDAPLTGAG